MSEEKKKVVKRKVATEEDRQVSAASKQERHAKATPKRIIACVFWLLGIVCEVLAILVLNKTLYVENQMLWLIIFLVADLILVIIGSQFWKSANDIDPASEKNKVKYFLQNQMGLIVACLAFFPIIILLLQNKDLDKKTKKIVTAVAAVALVVASLVSIDWNPISEEEYQQMQTEYAATTIYWTRWGHSYHTSADCPALSRTKEENLFSGTIDEALEAGRNDACDFCVDQSTPD